METTSAMCGGFFYVMGAKQQQRCGSLARAGLKCIEGLQNRIRLLSRVCVRFRMPANLFAMGKDSVLLLQTEDVILCSCCQDSNHSGSSWSAHAQIE
jgi:hypothetical protein